MKCVNNASTLKEIQQTKPPDKKEAKSMAQIIVRTQNMHNKSSQK